MTASELDIVTLLKRMRYDLTDLQAKVTDALNMVASLNIPETGRVTCPEPNCGVSFKSHRKLAEHSYTSHDGPEPEHWKNAEAMAEETEETQ